MIERIHLKVVKAVEEQGSLTAAARELCVTQSALSHTMRKLEDNLGVPRYNALAYENGVYRAMNVSYIVEKQTVPDQSGDLRFSFSPSKFYNPDLDQSFALAFNDDGTGVQQRFTDGQWEDLSTVYSWSLDNGFYIAEYYQDETDPQLFTTFCDVALDTCQRWRYRIFEVIVDAGDKVLVRVHQELYPNNELGSNSVSGYIGWFSKEQL